MPPHNDPVLAALLHGRTPAERERAWDAFVAEHSRLLLHTLRQRGGTHDDVMDRYAFVLEQLRADDFRRLRTWAGDGRSRLSTWLVVVARRLCTDHQRKRYGRSRSSGVDAADARSARRRLADLVGEQLRAEAMGDDQGGDPELGMRAAQLRAITMRAVETLDPSDQLILCLRFRDGLSAAEIARIVDMPTPFHVYRRLNQLLARLRQMLESRGIEDAVP